ncbi:phospholipase D family protein, partial [Lactobacillus helveticus]
MLTIYDLKNNVMLKQPDFFKLVEGFDTFEGVSFVGSFKIIEQELLPRFNQINLILGMEDQKTGKNLNQLLNVSNKVQQLLSVSSDFLERIEDQTLQLKFTKDELFHSKYFIVENDTDFIIFNGSMNLTQKALKHNHEMLWMYYGKKNNIQDLKIYEEHQKLFKKNFEEDSVDYLDRKIINNLYGKTKKQITAIIADEVVDKVQQNIVEVNPEDIIKVTKDAQRKEQTYELHPEIVQKVAKELFTEKGNKRRNEEKVREEIKQIIYQDFDDSSQNRVIKASELYPKLIWAYQDNEIITEDSNTNLFHTLNTNLDLVTKDDVRTFIRIIESFRLNKVKDESHQALSAFIYLMTAPMIWKIREIYRKSNFSKSADQIPLSMVLIGRGTTGKTLLVRDYFKKFIGDTSHSIQYTEINDGNASRTDKAVRFLDNYLHSARFISPMIVDELNSNFLHSKVALNAIKQWSNTITGIHNINIFAMNHNAGSKEINNLEEITKRVYYLSFEAPWLPTNQQEINYNILINDNNDHIYRYVVSELNKRLINLTGEEEAKLIDDYLSLTKDI